MAKKMPGVLMLSVIAVQLGALPLLLNRMMTRHGRGRTDSRWAVRSDVQRLRGDILRLVTTLPRLSLGSLDALVARFEMVVRDLEHGEDANAAEAAQRFQWEVVKARAASVLTRDTARSLLEDAQFLCEDLWAREGAAAAHTKARSGRTSALDGPHRLDRMDTRAE